MKLGSGFTLASGAATVICGTCNGGRAEEAPAAVFASFTSTSAHMMAITTPAAARAWCRRAEGAEGAEVGGAVGVVATADGEVQARQAGQSGDGAAVFVVGPHEFAAVRTVGAQRAEVLGQARFGPGVLLGHVSLSVARSP